MSDEAEREAKKAADAIADEAEKLAKETAEALKHEHKPAPVPAPPSNPTPSPTPPPPSTTPPPTPAPEPAPTGTNLALAEYFGPQFDSTKAFGEFTEQHFTITPDPDGDILTVLYPKGSTAPSMGAPYGGAQICLPFASGPVTSRSLIYQVRFPIGFQWVKGGKLPGLYGGVEPFSGGGHNAQGWSARLMWRPGQETPAVEDGPTAIAEIYAYVASNPSGYGADWQETGRSFTADGEWHTVSEVITVNSAGQTNGLASLLIDGNLLVQKTDLDITEQNVPIGGLFFSTFYGGHDPTWAPSADMHIDFRNFSIT